MNAVTCLRVASRWMGHLSLFFQRLIFTPSIIMKTVSFQDLPEEIAFSFRTQAVQYSEQLCVYQPVVDTNNLKWLMGKKLLSFLYASAFLLVLLIWLLVLWKFPDDSSSVIVKMLTRYKNMGFMRGFAFLM